MQTFDIQICMISGQPTPNLVPALSPDMRPKEVIMLVSKEMEKQADYLKNVLRNNRVKFREEMVKDAYDIGAMTDQIEDLIKQLGEEKDKPSIALNLTGGTKPMAIAAQTACFYNDIPYFYVRPDNNEIQLYLPGNRKPIPYQITSKLKLKDYLDVHGYRLEEQSASNTRSLGDKAKDLQDYLVRRADSFSEAIGTLNWLANEAEKKKTLSILIPDARSPEFDALLDKFQAAGIVSISGNTLRFTSEEARFFANGGWLEDFVFETVKQLSLQDCRKNCEVSSQSFASKNEIDVALLTKKIGCF